MAEILFPPGRMIGGNVDKLFARTESDGKTPKIGKDGKPEMVCNFGYAIPKQGEAHWAHTPWGAEIYKTGAEAHPQLVATPSFSWKVIDGDSQIPNKAGKRPCDQVGYPGHWILWFSQGWLPKRVNSDGTVELPEGAIVAGFYVQVYGSVAGNKLVPNGTPGVYLNPIAVALVGEGDRIATDVDTTAVGFGAAGLPAGARPVAPVVPGMPTPGVPPMPAGVTTPPPAPAPVAAPPVPAPAPVVAPAGPVMTAAANGVTYEAYKAANWTDEQLIAQGLMLAPAPVATPPAPAAAPPVGAPPIAPAMGFTTAGVPPVAPGYGPPPTPAAPVMTAKAQGLTYEDFKAKGWQDDQLRAQGYMV